MREDIHISFGCPTWGHDSRMTTSWKGVTCRVCTALYASWVWRRLARLMLTDEEVEIVAESDKLHKRRDRAMGVRRFPRWIVAMIPVLACVFCPAHLFLIIGTLTGGSMLGIHFGQHHHEQWHIIAAVAAVVWGALLFEFLHHRKSCNEHHQHHDGHHHDHNGPRP